MNLKDLLSLTLRYDPEKYIELSGSEFYDGDTINYPSDVMDTDGITA